MDFDLSEEQTMLKDSVERLLKDQYGFEARSKHGTGEAGYSDKMWNQYAELGLLALPFAEEDGGIGGGATETMIVMEAFGGALILEPFFASIILAGGVLRHAGNADQKAALIPAMAEGSLKMAFACAEPQGRYDLYDVETTATKDGDGWVINGKKALVLHGDSADKLIVSARTAGNARDEDGISLFIIDADAEGVTRNGYPTQDGLRAAEITLQSVKVGPDALIGSEGEAWPVISRVADEAIAALCAEAVGCFEKMHELTLEYLKTRSQFGTTIGSFQALQHRAVDMFVELEQSRSMTMYASMLATGDDAVERARAVSAAKAQIGESAKVIGREAVQLHGGVGMTMEYAIGHYFKRTTMLDILFGDANHHLKRLAQLDGLIREDS
ncbi:MAG: pimeloyl-CoA dehydrogenase small subunit [Hoeflea sp.]|uniref:acyl-CoA dehydrogenase family protein n=1 Tax=Hoeflea sp. TaxID=1940281 RepID=UPI000C0DC090|nr:acyl-CoA dehydrogenase family protein [Hoeflea sp.]PHR25285.1 MAG: pimeloyl-CoA dehydrogenase small subunit [Hoeflea sp.]